MGYVKSMDYAKKPATIDEFRTNVESEIAAVSADLQGAIQKFQYVSNCALSSGAICLNRLIVYLSIMLC